MKVEKVEKLIARFAPPVIVLAICVVAWDGFVRVFQVKPYMLPSPGAVCLAMGRNWDNLALSTWVTAQGALLGFFASLIFGMLSAILLASAQVIRRAFYPYTVIFQTVPIIAISPLLVIWLEPGLAAVAISAFIVSVFPVIAATLAGLLSTDPALVDLFKLYGAGPFARLWKLRLPSAIPSIITGLRVAGGLSVIGAVVSEFVVGLLGDGEGLGIRIITAKKHADTDLMFAEVICACLLGLAMFGAVNLAGRLLMYRWHASEKD